MAKFKHCFIKDNGDYREIPYTVLFIGKERNPEYGDRYFLPLHDCLLEVPFEDYQQEYQNRRRQKYIREEADLNGEVSYHALDSEDMNGEEIIRDLYMDVENEVITQIMRTNLYQALIQLTKPELELIDALYFQGQTERRYAQEHDVAHNAVHKRKIRILGKLKKIIEKF